MTKDCNREVWTGAKAEWEERWRRNEHTYGEHAPNDHLVAFADHMPPNGRVMLPLSGKSRDMIWLRDRGATVVGIEFVKEAAEAFFAENRIACERHERRHLVLEGEGIEIVVSDFFAVEPEEVGKIDWIFDRAALVAIRPEDRIPYVEQLLRFLEPGGQILLVALDHDQRDGQRPPFAIPPKEIARLFAGHELGVLDERDVYGRFPRLAQRVRWAYEHVWTIKKLQ
jgi:thiopurine S-methyltransferase